MEWEKERRVPSRQKERAKMTQQSNNQYPRRNPGPQRNSRRRRRRTSWLQRNLSFLMAVGSTLLVIFLAVVLIGKLKARFAGETPEPVLASQTGERQTLPRPEQPDSEGQTQATQTPATEPQTEAPQTQQVLTEAPQTEAPQTEAPQTEAPQTETASLPGGSDYDANQVDDASNRTVYLTFDDGPCKYTPEVLEILDQYGVKATFFTVGYYVDQYPENAKAIMDSGNLIACHSYTHEYTSCYASVDAFENECDRWKTAVTNACGKLPERLCFRFPGGSSTGYAKNVADGIKSRMVSKGWRWFDWNAGNNDKWPQGNKKGLSERDWFLSSYYECMDWYKNDDAATVVLITHETERTTVDTLGIMIQDLLDRGYTFKTLDHHPKWDD